MLIERIAEYTKRKELSNKAKSELVELLKGINFNNKQEIQDIVSELFKLHSDVLRALVTSLDEEKLKILVNEIDFKNLNKSFHIYVIASTLFKEGRTDSGKNILEQFITSNPFTGKINKQVFLGLDKALALDGSDVFMCRHSEWTLRNRETLRKIWIEAAIYLQKDSFSQCAMQWFKNNDIVLKPAEAAVLVKPNNEAVDAQQTKTDDTSVRLQELSTKLLLEELENRLRNSEEIKKERDEIKASTLMLKEDLTKQKNEIVSLQEKNNTIVNTNNELKNAVAKLENQLIESKQMLNDSQNEEKKLLMKLDNVESAYSHAGQMEVSAIVGKIKSRLASAHEKYIEIKAKEPDIDYYDVLLDILDEIFKVLKKNGIVF